jgi:hypothetical protein
MELEKKFAIRRITKTDDEEYATVLRIFNKATPIIFRVNDDAITFWLDKNNDSFELLIFALYLDKKLVGFAMMTYIKKRSIVVIDYIVLYRQYAEDNTIFSPYISLLQDFLEENNYNWEYIVHEISDEEENLGKEDHFFKKISYLKGFGKIEAKYRTPPIETKTYEIYEINSKDFLYIKSNFDMKRIPKNTYLNIVSSIYEDYYYVWHKDFLSPEKFKDYMQNWDKSFNSLKKEINSFRLYKSFTVNYLPGALLTSKNKKKVIIILVGIAILICTLLMLLFSLLKNPIDSASSIISIVLSSLLPVLATILMTKEKGE